MEIKNLDKKPNVEQEKKLKKKYAYFEKLINELAKKEIPPEIINTINKNIEEINSFSGSNKYFRKQIRKSQSNILKLIEKELGLVPRYFYLSRWMAFGLPVGFSFEISLGPTPFAIAIPIGTAIGMVIGLAKDKKAYKEGKQLDIKEDNLR